MTKAYLLRLLKTPKKLLDFQAPNWSFKAPENSQKAPSKFKAPENSKKVSFKAPEKGTLNDKKVGEILYHPTQVRDTGL